MAFGESTEGYCGRWPRPKGWINRERTALGLFGEFWHMGLSPPGRRLLLCCAGPKTGITLIQDSPYAGLLCRPLGLLGQSGTPDNYNFFALNLNTICRAFSPWNLVGIPVPWGFTLKPKYCTYGDRAVTLGLYLSCKQHLLVLAFGSGSPPGGRLIHYGRHVDESMDVETRRMVAD